MRNIKITALLLAVLMVVSAFAGCASSSDLENKVNEQANAIAGIQDSIKDLADAIANQGSSSELDDIKADIAENKQDAAENKQNIADILEAINGLKEAVAGATGESEDVKVAIAQAGAKVDALKEAYAEVKGHYTAEDWATITATLGAAQAAISTCVTAEAVAAEIAAMETALAACVRVDDSIYAYVVALEGNITDASADLVKEAQEALKAARKFYSKAATALQDALVVYEISEDEVINLETAIAALATAQNTTLPALKAEAEAIVKAIDTAIEEFNKTALETLSRRYRTFVRNAEKLSAENVALVTNADKLDEALLSVSNVAAALYDLQNGIDWEIVSVLAATYGTDVKLFADYEKLVATDDQAVIVFNTKNTKGATVKADTIKIYDAIDAKLAEFAAEYELTDVALEWVITQYKGDTFLAKYEADKALLKAFIAEAEAMADGIFADIKDLASATLTAASALDLVTKYEANAKAIDAWKDGLTKAYAAEYKALEDKNAVNYNEAKYDALLKKNFNAMAQAAELGEWKFNATAEKWEYKGYDKAFTISSDFYYDLYAFNYAENEKDLLGDFLKTDFPAAYAIAERINAAIKNFKVDQANSVLPLLQGIGGYYGAVDSTTGKPMLNPIIATGTTNPYAGDTIASFVFQYKTDNYDLSGMINTALYEEKVAAVAAAVDAAEVAVKALDSAYKALLGENNNVIVTMDNADAIIALEALLIQAKAAANVNVKKAIVKETKSGLNVYEIKDIVADVLAEGETAAQYYNRVLLSTDYANTEAGVTETGAIVRLVYQAKALKREATFVESAYKVIKQLNDATGGKAFAYSTLNDAATLITKLNAAEKDLDVNGYWYGIAGFDTATRTDSTGKTLYTVTAKMVRFNKDTGFYMGSIPGSENADKDTAIRSAIAATRAQWAYTTTAASANALYTLLFTTIMNDVKTTDSEALSTKFGASNKFFPAYTLPMIATYLEAKFVINNMGKTTDAITAAKAGWGDENSNYGFEYNKAMVANMLRVSANLDTAELTIIGNAANYSALTRAITNINEARADANKITFDIAFGHADSSWISDTYNLAKVDYAKGGAVVAPSTASTYADHDIDLTKLVVDLIFIWEAPAAAVQPQ